MVRSVLEKARGAKLALSPFPHIVIPDALDADYYQELMREFPTIETVNVKNKALRDNDDCFMGAVDVSKSAQVSSTWKEFFAYHTSWEFLMEALALAGSAATQLHPALSAVLAGMRKEDVVVADSDRPGKFHIQCQFGMNSPVISEKSVRIAHIDKPMKIYNALLYCRADDDDSVGGELILYKFHKIPGFYGNRTALPGRITEVLSVPYSRNTLVLFLNSAISVHGVRPRKPTPHIRRYINFQVELETENFQVPYINPVLAWIERKLSR